MPLPRPLHAGLALLALAVIAPSAQATSYVPPYSYRKTTPGGAFVFVMIGPLQDERSQGKLGSAAREAEAREVRRLYPRSGMYRNDDSTPLWTVDWYAGGVELASDGVHVVRHERLATYPHGEAVSFFANGVLLRTYTIRELVHRPRRCPGSPSPRFLDWQKRKWFDPNRLQFMVETNDDSWYLFDARTGRVVDASCPHADLWFAMIGGVALWVAVVVEVMCAQFIQRRDARRETSAADSVR